ncbi:polysaccharide deacetylase family protein [Streptomyces guryensis]|uniref:Polysaccharide deacetylase family protein n=1 Tax=Streptomyces guryensis TaxID=2886947 RepID=A0A9Q3VSE7_9ACTN|nr:polysaccharide deacetylase family protein [Streptomyces guryensis]MCD9876366.1 polysaccharide deacetylase family protein [Streptomyces guryensis]
MGTGRRATFGPLRHRGGAVGDRRRTGLRDAAGPDRGVRRRPDRCRDRSDHPARLRRPGRHGPRRTLRPDHGRRRSRPRTRRRGRAVARRGRRHAHHRHPRLRRPRPRPGAQPCPPPGHEIAVHGYHHRPLLLRGPRATYDDLARDAVADVTGRPPALFRPPYGDDEHHRPSGLPPPGVAPGAVDLLGRGLARAGHPSVRRGHRPAGPARRRHHPAPRLRLHLRHRLLAHHLRALPRILDACQARGRQVGPLREHGAPGLPGTVLSAGRPSPPANGRAVQEGPWATAQRGDAVGS